MATDKRKTVMLTRICKAGIERVFRAWTEPDDLKRWWTPNREWPTGHIEIDARVGGSFQIEFGPSDGETLTEHGEYLEFDPPNRIVYMEHVTRGDETIYGPAPCTITFRDLGEGRTEVIVVSTLDPGEGPDARSRGWGAALDGLVDIFE